MKIKRFLILPYTCLVLSVGLWTIALKPKPVIAAQRVTVTYGPLQFSLSIEALEAFVQAGQVTPELNIYARQLNDQTLTQLRQVLQQRLNEGPATVARFTYMPMGEAALRRLGNLIQTESGLNGFYAVRSALILAAADPAEGLTLLNVLRHFPGQEMRLNANAIFRLAQEWKQQSNSRDAVTAAIAQQTKLKTDSPSAYGSLPLDLRESGSQTVVQRSITIPVQNPHPALGEAASYPMAVDVYLPDSATVPTRSQPAPLIVLTHGIGATRAKFAYLGKHLASHGFAVAIPEHSGSNRQYLEAFLRGKVSNLLHPHEYLRRSTELTALLDSLERFVATDGEWMGRLDPQRVGIFGNSFGGTIALAAAGAEINSARLNKTCAENTVTFNLSILLQCDVRDLEVLNGRWHDSRIKAVFAAHPPTSTIFGPEGMGKIAIPTMLVAGSHDQLVPAMPEQVYPFSWLNVPQKYLALIVPGTHYSADEDAATARLPSFLRGSSSPPSPTIARGYLQALSVAFFGAHLDNRSDYLPYLQPAYAKAITHADLQLSLVQSLSPTQLQQAEQKLPPKSIAAGPH